VLTRPIDWELIRHHYDEMVKYATALGTAETESILRRFTRSSVQHPAYRALSELGRAVKTIFLCRYLHSEALRREIHEGLNVIEQWNGANDFLFFARRGELASNRREDHEVSMLSLHLLQNCMVYVNTLMLQQVLAQPHWTGRLTSTDLRALNAADLGARQPLRPLRAGYGDTIAARVIDLAPGDTNVGITPQSMGSPPVQDATLESARCDHSTERQVSVPAAQHIVRFLGYC
jgi:Tn3 transposase DDE domain